MEVKTQLWFDAGNGVCLDLEDGQRRFYPSAVELLEDAERLSLLSPSQRAQVERAANRFDLHRGEPD